MIFGIPKAGFGSCVILSRSIQTLLSFRTPISPENFTIKTLPSTASLILSHSTEISRVDSWEFAPVYTANLVSPNWEAITEISYWKKSLKAFLQTTFIPDYKLSDEGNLLAGERSLWRLYQHYNQVINEYQFWSGYLASKARELCSL